MLDILTDPLQEETMRLALIEVVLMGIVTGAIGAYVVVRGLSFMGDALSHAIFPGIVIAVLLDGSIFVGALAFGIVTAIGIGLLARNERVKEDSAIGVLFAGMFALGVVIYSAEREFDHELSEILFGDVLTVSWSDIAVTAACGAVVLLALTLLHKEFVAVAFDRTAARAVGLPVFWLDVLLLVLISLTIVVSLRSVGNILVVAMLITPAATARLLTDRLTHTMALAALLGASAGVIGLYISYHEELAAGGTIVLVSTAIFGLAWLFAPTHGYVTSRFLRRVALTPTPEAQVLVESPEIRSHNP